MTERNGPDAEQLRYPRSLADPIPARPVADGLTVVIPTLGRPILETCLAYLADGTRWPESVVIVDQGRQPSVEAMLGRLAAVGMQAAYVPSSRRGRSAGINRGLETVRTRFVALTDDDCFVARDWVERMQARLADDPGTIVTGRVELAGDDEAPFSVVVSREPRRYTAPQLKVHPFIGGNAGMAMTIVERVGPFDEHPCLASAEDSDYGHRALRLGIPIAYDPDVVLYHYHWRDVEERIARYGDYARSQGGFYGTHIRNGDLLVALQAARAMVRSPLRWARGVLRGDRELAANGRASTLNFPPGIVAGLFRRDRPPTGGGG